MDSVIALSWYSHLHIILILNIFDTILRYDLD